ncbi:hypothetical protein M4951_21630 [Blastopirellula sp. J2-11]|uniref:hypothetical protein n=1 Tax=Blastopirellula sp. J2-11 TaxID=2943192 RepID=UPI0021CA1CB1|nr:hypothetical protein [Blastopirellula sp. J2-11]UUO05955.1 hypothetical protein M4951_21630 [Blastopirellula sp. J2-11]
MNSPASDNPFQSPAAPSGPVSNEEAIVAEGIFSSADWDNSYLLTLFNRGTVKFLLLTILLPSILFLFITGTTLGKIILMLILMLILLCLLVVAMSALVGLSYWCNTQWRTTRRRLAENPEPRQITISSAGIRVETPTGTQQYRWSEFSGLASNQKVIVLTLRIGVIVMTPSHFFESKAAYQAALRNISAYMLSAAPDNRHETAVAAIDSVPNDEDGAIVGSGELSWQEAKNSYWHIAWKSLLVYLVLFVTASGIGLTIAIQAWFRSEPFLFTPETAVWSAAAGSIAWISWQSFRTLRNWYRDQVVGVIERWTITDIDLTCTSPRERMKYRWNEMTKTYVQPERIILIHRQFGAIQLPRRFFASDEDWRQVVDWAA